MDTQRWQSLQELFANARAATEDERERLLQEHARVDAELVEQVRALLAADAQPGIMDALGSQLQSIARVVQEPALNRIGPYRVIGELGRGGMGVVYHAERADGQFQQRVAIKLISATNADHPLHQRFLAERQILAGLVHPNIARLLDGGITDDGRPYLVMEYVDGVPITTYCDRHRLDVRARLKLFVDVCAAVQHAHQNLVVHRDLKPSNILVSSDGRVHLLDFGIAKLINPSGNDWPVTHGDARAMTPEYASPEQVCGAALTTASDIYSLGVLLYELLSGSLPYRLATGSPVEVATAVCEQDPEPPSQRAAQPERAAQSRGATVERLARQLEGDLDGIVLMAMRKEPRLRYASADMLRQDIERYQRGLQVHAHRGNLRYRIGKLVRRHRVETAAAAIVLGALVTGLTVAIGQSRRASRERDRAEQALIESEGVTSFLLDLFQTGDPGDPPPAELSALDLLRRGALRADELSNQPIAHARLLDVIGQMSLHLGRWVDAERYLEQAVAIRRSTLGSNSPELATSLIHLGWVYRAQNRYDRARPLVAEALAIRQRALPPNHPDIGDAFNELGWLSGGRSQERLYQQALAILPDTGAAAERRIAVLQGLTTNLRRQGRLTEALAADRDALRTAERSFGPDHHVTGSALIHLGDQVKDIEQDAAAAEQLYRRGLDLLTRHFGENSIRLIHGLNSLADLLSSRGDAAAEQLYRRALAIRQSATGPEHPSVADQQHRLARELARQGRTEEAEALARQALELSTRTLGAASTVITSARLPLLAEIFERQGRHREADETYRSALEQITLGGVVPGQMRRE
ncbi:MAG TPA: serine/threonine-protein kinase, partial [Longimicrobiales bacterium]|nr:serine/threonine-protein kinase [Longimicrobiales bacterium]